MISNIVPIPIWLPSATVNGSFQKLKDLPAGVFVAALGDG